MWIKICGNTNLEDARLAAELGANAVGFIFAASKRQVTAAVVASIAPHLPPEVERVGVFDSHDAEEIARIALQAGLTAVQLHGGFDEPLLRKLTPLLLPHRVAILQTLHWQVGQVPSPEGQLAAELARAAALGVDRFLIDSKIGASASGGTGIAFDWPAARKLFASAPDGVRLIVAGGLTPENVATAIAELAPWGVDVSSGVEAAPGRKDLQRLAGFIENAREESPPSLRRS